MSAQLSPTPIFKGFANDGTPLAYGRLTTYAAGTTTPQATYIDSTQTTPNTNPIILNARGECALWLNPLLSYKYSLTDLFGNQIAGYPVDNIPGFLPIDSSNIHYDITPAETAAGVTPVNYSYPAGQLPRYGGDPTGMTDSSTPWQSALSVSAQASGNTAVDILAGSTFKVLTAAAVTGQITIIGHGKSSKLQCDGTLVTITNGNNSVIDNVWVENLSPPWIVTRNPANWGATIPASSLVQSNTQLGYQPTVNDPEYSTWVASIPAVGTQNIGPVFLFSGAATSITVSRIYGRFARVQIMDAIYSSILDCDIRGGKGIWGALEFDNWTNGIQRGVGNRAQNNRVIYASFVGVFQSANDDFINEGNTCFLNGESGLKTLQALGAQFTGSVSGATSGTLTAPIANGSYTFVFSDAEVRTVTVTGTTACTWSGALGTPAVGIITASLYQTTLNPQCFRGTFVGNKCNENFFDGLDCFSTFDNTNDAAQTFHTIVGNHAYNNGHQGINMDGQFNSYIGNKVHFNYTSGLGGLPSRSVIADNDCVDNNQVRNSSQNDISVAGLIGLCKISGNKVYAGTGQNNFGIYAPGTHFIGENFGDGSTFFFGNPSQIPSVVQNYADAFTGLLTDQAFTITIVNTSGTMQHAIFSDFGSGALGNLSSRINGASASLVNTPSGTDSTTAMVNGVKIGSASTNVLWFDVAPQVGAMADLVAVIATQSTGVSIYAMCQFSSININGITQTRLAIQFSTAAGGAFAINTTNITVGNAIRIQFKGKLS